MKTIRMTMIGAGDWVRKYHLPAVQRLAESCKVQITGIWNRTESRAAETAAAFGIRKVYRDLDEAVNERDTDCFSVVLAPEAVFDVLLKLAVRRLPIFCEKPPGENGTQARRLADIITWENLVAFNRRYVPLVREFYTKVHDSGNLDFVECHFIRRGRTIPNFLTATGVHGFNLLEYLFGPINTARPIAGTGNEDPDNSGYNRIAELVFDSGLTGIVKFIPAAGFAAERIEAHGRGRSLYLNLKQHYTDEEQGSITLYSDHGKETPEVQILRDDPSLDIVEQGGFLGQYEEFFRSLRDGTAIRSTFQNAWSSVAAAESLQQRMEYRRGPWLSP
jgi:predicted dehydrogenase